MQHLGSKSAYFIPNFENFIGLVTYRAEMKLEKDRRVGNFMLYSKIERLIRLPIA